MSAPPVLTAVPNYLELVDHDQQKKILQLIVMFIQYLQTHPQNSSIEIDDFGNNIATQTVPSGTKLESNEKKRPQEYILIGEELEKLTLTTKDIIYDFEKIAKHPFCKIFFQITSTDDFDTAIARFLRARKWNLPAAFAMLVGFCSWRLDFGVHSLMQEGESHFPEELLASGKGFIWEEDKHGRVCCYARAKLHNKDAQPLRQSCEYLVFWLETGRILRRNDQQLVTVVVDLNGATFASLDLPFAKFMFNCLQAYYPEILGQVLILDAPWLFWSFWKMVSPFIDPIVAAKIKFIQKSELKHYIDDGRIPQEFGGSSRFSWPSAYTSPPNSKPKVEMLDENNALRLRSAREIFLRACVDTYRALDGEKMTDLFANREALKTSLRREYYKVFRESYPHSIYHRLGVFDSDERIVWSQYRGTEPPPENGHHSAPPGTNLELICGNYIQEAPLSIGN